MKLSDVLRADAISLDCSAESSEQLLHCIAEMASNIVPEVSEEVLFNALSDRETLSSTYCGHGVAIPHCRIEGLSRFIAGFIVPSEGIDFNAANGEKALLFPFVLGPENEPRKHLKILSSLAQIFRDGELRNSLLNAASPEDAAKILLGRISADATEDNKHSGAKLIHLFVQDESVFNELLSVFATAETSSSMIMDADESTRFLMNIPFFASFWNTDIQHFNRIIVSVVKKELVNAVIRNIEFVCGSLSDRNDVMVTVSDIHSVYGSLES